MSVKQFRLIILILVAIVLVQLVVTPREAQGAPNTTLYESPMQPSASGIYVTGDSITNAGGAELLKLRPKWHVEGVPGRQVQTLDRQISEILSVDPTPRAIVVALGTNTKVGHEYDGVVYPNDHFRVYPEALAQVPAGTCVVLVTAYRDPDYFNLPDTPEWKKSWQSWRYSKAMWRLKEERPRTKIANWRYTAARNPHLLSDGVHGTAKGRKVWAKRVSDSLSGACG